MKTIINKISTIVFFSIISFFSLNAQVTATGTICAEVIDDYTSIITSASNLIITSENTTFPTVFTINDPKNTEFYLATTPTTLTDSLGNTIPTEQMINSTITNGAKNININTSINTTDGFYTGKLNVNVIYN